MGVSVEVYLEALLTASADWQTAEEQINSAATKVNETLPDCGDLGEGGERDRDHVPSELVHGTAVPQRRR